jgi:hypothetical protein
LKFASDWDQGPEPFRDSRRIWVHGRPDGRMTKQLLLDLSVRAVFVQRGRIGVSKGHGKVANWTVQIVSMAPMPIYRGLAEFIVRFELTSVILNLILFNSYLAGGPAQNRGGPKRKNDQGPIDIGFNAGTLRR